MMKRASAETKSSLLSSSTGRKVLFAGLYLSEGAPIGFIWYYLPEELRRLDVPIDDIAALQAVAVLPWTLKFLYAPFVDCLRGTRWTHRSWIIAAQVCMGIMLLPLFIADPREDLAMLRAFLVAHGAFAALQDVAIDGLAVTVTPERERGAINAWMNAGMWGGRVSFGAALLVAVGVLADVVGGPTARRLALGILIGTIWCTTLLVLLGVRGAPAGRPDETLSQRLRGFAAEIRSTFLIRSTLLGLVFAATAGVAYEAVGSVLSPFLVDLGLSKEGVGAVQLAATVPAVVLGGLAGGYLADRVGRRWATGFFLSFLALAILNLAWGTVASLLWGLPEILLVAVTLACVYFGIGLFTASSYGLFMDLTQPRLAATQFAVFMSMTNVCEAWATRVNGKLVTVWGYPGAFSVLALASLLTLPLLRGMEPRRREGRSVPA